MLLMPGSQVLCHCVMRPNQSLTASTPAGLPRGCVQCAGGHRRGGARYRRGQREWSSALCMLCMLHFIFMRPLLHERAVPLLPGKGRDPDGFELRERIQDEGPSLHAGGAGGELRHAQHHRQLHPQVGFHPAVPSCSTSSAAPCSLWQCVALCLLRRAGSAHCRLCWMGVGRRGACLPPCMFCALVAAETASLSHRTAPPAGLGVPGVRGRRVWQSPSSPAR